VELVGHVVRSCWSAVTAAVNCVCTARFRSRAPAASAALGNDASIAGLKPMLPVVPSGFTRTSTTWRERTVGTVTPSEKRRVIPSSPETGNVR
jgi:hypothetical protein